MISLKQFAKFT